MFIRIKTSFFRQSSDGHELDLVHRWSTINTNNKSILGCTPSIIQGAIHHLSSEQLRLLDRGPTYVPPCQIHRSLFLKFDHILQKQIAPLQQQLTKLFTKYKVNMSRRWIFEEEIQKQFISSFSISLSRALEERALYEAQLVRSLQDQLKRERLILRRTADEYNTYYLGHLDDFNHKVDEYITDANWFKMIGMIDKNNSEQQQLNEITKSIDLVLEELVQKKQIPKEYLSKLKTGKRININLPYLYFLPETNRYGNMVVRPRLSSWKNAPIQPLATYLEQLLRPIFEKFSPATILNNGPDFLQKLQNFCSQGDNLLPLTNFITFKIHNLPIRISHDDILLALNRLLHRPVNEDRHDKLTSDTIEELTRFVLRNNIFTYKNKIYRYVKGSPISLSISELLFNIYLQDWQQPLVRQIRIANQFYGRYDNIGIMSWYGPTEKLFICIQEMNRNNPDIQITTSVGTRNNFLNVDIENRKGDLYTRIYHDKSQQPFLIPYASGHPRIAHRQWFRYTLLRAGQYSCSWEDFSEERLRLELTFLANGYSLDFVRYHLEQFFTRFNPKGITLNRWTYSSFRKSLFRSLTEQQKQAQLKTPPIIHLHYLYDWGFRCEFNQKFYQLWSEMINADPQFQKYGLIIKLNSKHCYSLNTLFNQQ